MKKMRKQRTLRMQTRQDVSSTMKGLLVGVLVLCSAGSAFSQGSLTPTRPPQASMRTLTQLNTAIADVGTAVEQVEARIDLATVAGDTIYHHIISESGSYYLSGNLDVTLARGIMINATDVTLDLNGFKISRTSGSGGHGIFINGEMDRATIRNGNIAGFLYGIYCFTSPARPEGCLFEKLTVSDCTSFGIYAGNSSSLIDCRAHDNQGNCAILALSGSLLSGCIVNNNECTYGLYASDGSVLNNCSVYDNQVKYGIRGATGMTLQGCSAYKNKGSGDSSYGIYTESGSTVVECTARSNSNTNTTTTASQGIGIYASSGSTIKHCTVAYNQGDGIRVGSDCHVEGNTCDNNGYGGDGAGIHATIAGNRIDSNHITDNDRGIDVDSSGASIIIRNTASGNGTHYDIASGNKTGEISGDPYTAGPWANFGF